MSQPCQSACSPWATEDDFQDTIWAGKGTEDLRATMLAVATDLLFEWSGRKWPGSCSDEATLRSYRTVCRDARVALGAYPITSITSVEELDTDGVTIVTVDPSAYRVDSWKWLVREDEADGTNKGWALDGKTTVAFTYGAMPPPDGKVAAVELAGELVLARTDPGECRLPQKVTSVVRQGVSISFAEPGSFKTLPSVQAFLDARNPTGRRRRAGVLNPDLDVKAVRQGT